MSSLGPLFIPRKDNLTVPKTTDNPDLGSFLRDLYHRIHTNELAVQRWANAVPRLAAVMGTASSVIVSTTDPSLQKPLPLDGVTNAYFSGVIDSANDRIVIPADGWYTLSASAQWTPNGVGDQSGVVEIFVYKNGTTTPGTQIVSSGPMVEVQQTVPPISVSAQDFQSFSFTSVFARQDTLEPYAINAIFLAGGGNTTATAKITALALDFLGPTPTSVQ